MTVKTRDWPTTVVSAELATLTTVIASATLRSAGVLDVLDPKVASPLYVAVRGWKAAVRLETSTLAMAVPATAETATVAIGFVWKS